MYHYFQLFRQRFQQIRKSDELGNNQTGDRVFGQKRSRSGRKRMFKRDERDRSRKFEQKTVRKCETRSRRIYATSFELV